MGSSRRRTRIPAFAPDVLGCLRSSTATRGKAFALRPGGRLAAYTRRDPRRYFHKLLGRGTEVICAVERYEESRRFGPLDAPDEVHQPRGPNVAFDHEGN